MLRPPQYAVTRRVLLEGIGLFDSFRGRRGSVGVVRPFAVVAIVGSIGVDGRSCSITVVGIRGFTILLLPSIESVGDQTITIPRQSIICALIRNMAYFDLSTLVTAIILLENMSLLG